MSIIFHIYSIVMKRLWCVLDGLSEFIPALWLAEAEHQSALIGWLRAIVLLSIGRSSAIWEHDLATHNTLLPHEYKSRLQPEN